jgi:hypothetical protein
MIDYQNSRKRWLFPFAPDGMITLPAIAPQGSARSPFLFAPM